MRRGDKFLLSILVFMTIMLVLAIYSHEARAWSESDTDREVAWQVINVLDYYQTSDIAGKQRYEQNPTLGKHPSQGKIDKYFVIAALSHWGISYALPFDHRRSWQWLTIGVSGGIVYHNHTIGLRVGFSINY